MLTQRPCGTDLRGGSGTEEEHRKNSPGVTSDLREVITGTLSSGVTLYLNLKPACLSFCGPDADFCTKVAELFAALQKLLKGNDRNKVTRLHKRIIISFDRMSLARIVFHNMQ